MSYILFIYFHKHYYYFPDQSDIKYNQMPSPAHQNVVNLNLSLSIRRRPSKLKVRVWQHCSSDNENYGCDNIYCTNSIIITNFVQTFIPNCRFKNVFLAYFGIEI
jgi:hypothetical protein